MSQRGIGVESLSFDHPKFSPSLWMSDACRFIFLYLVQGELCETQIKILYFLADQHISITERFIGRGKYAEVNACIRVCMLCISGIRSCKI